MITANLFTLGAHKMKRRILLTLALTLAIIYIYAVISIKIHGLAYYAYPCIDTLPNDLCDFVFKILGY